MGTMMESKMTRAQHALIKAILVAQTESIGNLEAPLVADLLRKGKCRRVLDIGCGEGSFLLKVAAQVKNALFVGIDQNHLAVEDARRRLDRTGVRNAAFQTAFFDPSFERIKYDAVLTRYTLQHASHPETFVRAVLERLKKKGLFIAVESLDAHSGCAQAAPVWIRFLEALHAIHARGGSNDSMGQTLGRLFRGAGFAEVRVLTVLCSPSTAGYARFRDLVRASARTAFGLCPDLFDRRLLAQVERWLADKDRLERLDPYLCTAVARGIKP